MTVVRPPRKNASSSSKKLTHQQIVKQIFDEEVTYYTDELNPCDVYVSYPLPNGAKAFEPCNSEAFKCYSIARYCDLSDKMELPDFLDYPRIKEARAVYNGDNPVKIGRRVVGSIASGKIVYFLADDLWRVVTITKDGWTIGTSEEVKFLKSPLELPQVEPMVGARDLMTVLPPFINMEEEEQTIFIPYLVDSYSPDTHHFLAILPSQKGTGKTTLTKAVCSLVDPTKAPANIMPNSDGDLKAALNSRYLYCIDNAGKITESKSNILCNAVTGGFDMQRTLYTNTGVTTLEFKNMLILNGINALPEKDDLADRSLRFDLKKLSKRKSDGSFWAEFEKVRPEILGAIFDTLSRAMVVYPTVTIDNPHRMTEANLEMMAIATVLKIDTQRFQSLLMANAAQLQENCSMVDPFVEGVFRYVENCEEVSGTTRDVFDDIRETLADCSFLPSGAQAFGKKLQQSKTDLEGLGVVVERSRTSKNSTHLTMKLIPKSKLTKEQKTNRAKLAASA